MGTKFSNVILEEKGSAIIRVDFKDENDIAIAPNTDTIKWTLTNRPDDRTEIATVINNRVDVAESSSSTIYIILEDEDLKILDSETALEKVERVLLVKYQYNSDLQNDIDSKAQLIFTIENLYYPT